MHTLLNFQNGSFAAKDEAAMTHLQQRLHVRVLAASDTPPCHPVIWAILMDFSKCNDINKYINTLFNSCTEIRTN